MLIGVSTNRNRSSMPLIGDPRLRIYIFGSEPMNENGLDWMEGIKGSMEIRGYLTGIMGF